MLPIAIPPRPVSIIDVFGLSGTSTSIVLPILMK